MYTVSKTRKKKQQKFSEQPQQPTRLSEDRHVAVCRGVSTCEASAASGTGESSGNASGCAGAGGSGGSQGEGGGDSANAEGNAGGSGGSRGGGGAGSGGGDREGGDGEDSGSSTEESAESDPPEKKAAGRRKKKGKRKSRRTSQSDPSAASSPRHTVHMSPSHHPASSEGEDSEPDPPSSPHHPASGEGVSGGDSKSGPLHSLHHSASGEKGYAGDYESDCPRSQQDKVDPKLDKKIAHENVTNLQATSAKKIRQRSSSVQLIRVRSKEPHPSSSFKPGFSQTMGSVEASDSDHDHPGVTQTTPIGMLGPSALLVNSDVWISSVGCPPPCISNPPSSVPPLCHAPTNTSLALLDERAADRGQTLSSALCPFTPQALDPSQQEVSSMFVSLTSAY